MSQISHIFNRSIKRTLLLTLVFSITFLVAVGTAVAGSMYFRAHLSGKYAIPSFVDTQAQGEAIFNFNDDGTISYKLIVANIENVRMAHIHLVPESGTGNGPILVWLYPSAPPPVTISGRFEGTLAEGMITDESMQFSGVAELTLDQLRDYIEMGKTYVNVHTDQFPAGEIHGPVR